MLADWIQKTAIQRGIERHAQFTMIVVSQGDEAERLQARALKLARWIQHLGHAMDGAGSGVEGNLHEISARKLSLQLEQSAIEGNGLKFGACTLAAFGDYRGCDGSVEFNSGSTLAGIA